MNEQWFERIEDYLNGKMSADEQLRFEQEMAMDNALAEDFNLYREIEKEMRDAAAHYKEEAALKKSLESLNKKYFSQDNSIHITEPQKYLQKRTVNLWRLISIAAAISGVIA